MNTHGKLIVLLAAFVVALHVFGALVTTHLTWGFHLFGFHAPATSLIALAAGLACFHPRVQSAAGGRLERVVRRISSLPAKPLVLAVIGVIIALSYFFAPELHLLGDSAILMRSIPKSAWGAEVISSFRNQPLLNEIYRWAMNVNPSGPMTNPKEVYQAINLIAAALLVMLTFWFVRALPRPPVERALLGFLLFTAAGTQFFFGYVENYVLQYVATAAFAVTGWLALERRVHIAVPLAILVVLPGLNLGTAIFAPAGLFLILTHYRERKTRALLILSGLAVAGAAMLFAIGFDFAAFLGKFASGNVDFLPIFTVSSGINAYPMFSVMHALDWFNAVMLFFPLGLFIPAVLLFSMPKGERLNNPALMFLLILTLCGFLFTWIINFALGMARDWDNICSFLVPLVILNIYLLGRAPAPEPRRPVLLLVSVISFLHLAAFIGVNDDAGRHMARMKTLNDPRLLSRSMQMTYDEALANYFFGVQNYPEARIYYEHFMSIDSNNTRIIGNISDVYRKLGEKEKYFYQLKRGASLKSPNPGLYSNLGVEYAERGDTNLAIAYNAKAIELDSNTVNAHANIGILFVAKGEYRNANRHFAAAIRLGMRDPRLFRFAAESAMRTGDVVLALNYYENAVQRAPADTATRGKRDRLRAILKEQGVIQ